MAANIPSLAGQEPPRITATPPLGEDSLEALEADSEDYGMLSPLNAQFTRSVSPARSYLSPHGPSSVPECDLNRSTSNSSDENRQPFSYAPQQYVVSRPPITSNKQTELGRRRGHKYARSSVSHQIILSPTPRLPLQLPTSLPMPTFKEFMASMTSEQRNRWLFCFLQTCVAGYVQYQAHESLAMTALSHLLFFDVLSALLCTTVDVGRNFEVWTRSSLRNPFGLERSEVVAGLAMSIVLLFMGLDLVSHGLTHSLEDVGGHVAHHAHDHDRLSTGGVCTAALSAILSTLLSTSAFGDHERIGRVISSSKPPPWAPEVLRNPSHLLTIICSTLLLGLPFLETHSYNIFDGGLSLVLAVAMMLLGGRLCYRLGRMLLMSFPLEGGAGVKEVVSAIEADNAVKQVLEAKVWQVHYGLCMASFKIRVHGKENIEKVRDKVGELVKSKLGGGASRGSLRWEVSTMVTVDKD